MINIAAEGESDREVAKAVVRAAGRTVNQVRIAGGKSRLDPLIAKYNAASSQAPWVVFRDSDSDCPVTLRNRLLSSVTLLSPQFSLRIAHSMTEAWLLADADSFADYFGVPVNRVPREPDHLQHAKQTLISLCVRSRSRRIRDDMTAPSNHAGPLYVARLNDFASTAWRAWEASSASDSLRRAINHIQRL